MDTASAQISYFECLPTELHCIILALLPDFWSLRSVVTASRSAHDAYVLSSQSIQWNVLRRLLYNAPQLSAESWWLHAASYIRRNTSDARDNMDEFLAYNEPDIERQHPPNSLDTVTAGGLRFHIIIEDLTSAFVKAAVHSSSNGALRTPEVNIWNFPLQLDESIRIQRALYRFQRICQMYPRNTQPWQPGARRPEEHPLGEFVKGLPSWELEELRCVYRFLTSSLSFLDDTAYSALICAQSVDQGLPSYRYKEHVVSMGLVFLRKLLTSPIETQLALLKQYCGHEVYSLSDVLPLDGADNASSLHVGSSSVRIQSLFGPSAGWVLFQSASTRDHGRAHLSELRNWGYCFWEHDRLEASGVYGTESESAGPNSWIHRICDSRTAL